MVQDVYLGQIGITFIITIQINWYRKAAVILIPDFQVIGKMWKLLYKSYKKM